MLSQVPIVRASEEAVKLIICEGMKDTSVDSEVQKRIEAHGYPFIFFAYLNGTDTEPNRPGLYMIKFKSKSFGSI